MWEFLDRLLSLALPRIRDFRGSTASSSMAGQLHLRSHRAVMFHEIDQDKIDRQRGMDITVVTTTKDDEGRARCSSTSASPSRRTDMAKTALKVKAPQAQVQGARLHALPGLRSSALRVPQVRPVPHLPSRDGSPRRAARRHQVQLVNIDAEGPRPGQAIAVCGRRKPRRERALQAQMTMTDPIADMLTRLRNASAA
jgi:hypothetical protein